VTGPGDPSGRKKGKLQKARQEVAKRGEPTSEPERSRRRVEHLYEISRVLARFHGLDRSVSEVIGLVGQTLTLRSAILILKTGEAPRSIVWQTAGESEEQIQAAKAHAREAYRYLLHHAIDLEHEQAAALDLARPLAQELRAEPERKGKYVTLPLVIERGSIFGVLQFQAVGPLGEEDLIFLNAVTSQLAIAVDREAAINARQANAEASEAEQRLLADVSTVVGSSLDYREALAALAQILVPRFSDQCLVEAIGEDGKVERLAVRFADETKQREFGERAKLFAPRPGWQTPDAKAIFSGSPVLLSRVGDPLAEGIAHDEEHAEILRALGIRSLMALPLVARGRAIGALVFSTSGSRRRYSVRDLALAEEIARRGALAIDNARLYEQAQRATRARDTLLAVVSHDLKNPLGVILMNLSVLLRRKEEEDRRRSRKQLVSIQRSARRMIRITGDLLAIASIEAGRLSIQRERLEVAPLVLEAVEAQQSMAASQSLQMRSELPSGLPAIYADSARLQQVLVNLLGNAIKFTPKGGNITVRAMSAGAAVTFAVADSGPGIAQDEIPHLFDRFWQAERTARLGTGLGLFIVQEIVKAHGGRVWVETKVGEGSTFYFTIPIASPGMVQLNAEHYTVH
jgi:signal transduction histidine kinase